MAGATNTENDSVVALPDASCDEHVTFVGPSWNVVPDAGEQVTCVAPVT